MYVQNSLNTGREEKAAYQHQVHRIWLMGEIAGMYDFAYFPGNHMSGGAYLLPKFMGRSFFAYSSKLPAYSGALLLTVDNISFLTYSWSFFAYSFSFSTYSWSFLLSGKVRLIRALRALRDCKQRSLTVSKKAPTVSKKASPKFMPMFVTI